MKMSAGKILKIVAFVAIVGAGISVYYYLVSNRPVPPRLPKAAQAMVVETARAVRAEEPLTVSAMGLVIPARSVSILPEVSGQVVYVNPRLVPGGRVRRGEVLVKIDPRDFELQLEQQQANLARAEMELARERGLKKVAEREWKLIESEVQPTAEGKQLALRDIQLRTAQAALAAARSMVDQAKLRMEKTTLTAPFNALVTEKLVDYGQIVSPASRVATLVDTDEFWVRVAVPLGRVSFIQVPGQRGHQGQGSPAEIRQQVRGMELTRAGKVIQLLGDLDPRGKTARLLISVPNPLGSADSDGNDVPLLLGSFVAVDIKGPHLSDVVAVPRPALQDNNRVWVKTAEGKLEVRQVEVVWSDKESAYLRGELQPDEEVIITRLATPVPGMAVVAPGDKQSVPDMQPEKSKDRPEAP